MQGNWFKDESIVGQEMVVIREGGKDQDAVSLLVEHEKEFGGSESIEIILTRAELLKCLSEMEC